MVQSAMLSKRHFPAVRVFSMWHLIVALLLCSPFLTVNVEGWGNSFTVSGQVSTAYAGDKISVSLTPSAAPGSSNTITITVTCSGGTSTISGTWSWSGKANPPAQAQSITPTQGGVTLTCSYTTSGNAAGSFTAPASFTVTVSCQISQITSAQLGPYQPGAGLACVNRVNLAAFYPFTYGIAARDASAAAVNPTVQGTITYSTDKYGLINGEGEFDGSTSDLVSSFYVQPTVLTLSFWFSTTDGNAGFNCVTGTSFGYDRCLRLISGLVSAYLWLGSTSEVIYSPAGKTYNDGTWHHLVYQYGPGVPQAIWMDGSKVIAGIQTASAFNTNANVHFGYDTQIAAYYNGKMDNIAMWSSVLSSGDIGTLYSTTWTDQIICTGCGTLTYSQTTPYASLKLTLTFAGTAQIKWQVNGGALSAALVSGTATGSKNLNMGSNTVTIVAGEGSYVINVNRVCDLHGVTFSPAIAFTPSFACGTNTYTANVPFTTSTPMVTITYLTSGTNNHIYGLGSTAISSNLVSGSQSAPATLKIGLNALYVNGSVEGNYVFYVYRRCDITGLAFVPPMKLTPPFQCDVGTYTSAIAMSVTTISAIANFTTGSHDFTVNSVQVTYFGGMVNNVATGVGYMFVASNIITITQTDGPTITITVQKLTDAQSLSFSSMDGPLTLSPAFVAGTLTGYTMTVPFIYNDIAATTVCTVATAQFQVNGVIVDPSMDNGQVSLTGKLLSPTSYSSITNNVQVINSIDGAYTVIVTILPQDVRNFTLQCTTVFGATGIFQPFRFSPGQLNLNISLHARYGTCQLAITYLTAGTVTISSEEPYSGNAAATGTYSSHVINLPLGTPLLMNVSSTLDGVYTLNITRNAWDVTSLDLQVGGGPASSWYLSPLTTNPTTFIQTTPTYTASVKYMTTGVSIRAMCNGVISAEMIRSGGPFVNMMPTGLTAPFTLNVGPNLIRFISAKDNGSPFPATGYTSYNFTVVRNASSLTGIAMKVSSPSTTWTTNIKPAFSVDVFNYAVDVPISYTAAQFAPAFTGANTITMSFSGNAAFATITTTGTFSSLQNLLTGLASANGANYFTFYSVEDGYYTITVNRPVDVKSIVAYADGSAVPLSISPALIPTFYSYTISVPFKTQNIQLNVNYTAASTLCNQANSCTIISPNVNTINIATSYTNPVTLTFSNSADGNYTIQIVYQSADVQAFNLVSNMGPLTLTPPFTNNMYSYTAYSYGVLNTIQLATTYATPVPPINVTANGLVMGTPASLVLQDLSSVLTQAVYLTTGVVTVLVNSPNDGVYSISIQPACPQPYTNTPGTPGTPLCQFFASYCKQPTSGYTRVCMLTRPGCCGDPGCLC